MATDPLVLSRQERCGDDAVLQLCNGGHSYVIGREGGSASGWLPTHTGCNSSFKVDEEYYIASFAGHAQSNTGRAVFDDFRRAVNKGHDVGLLKTGVNQFGKVLLANGSRVFNFDADRAGRITWKLVRGLYFGDVGRFLPEHQPKRLIMLSPEQNKNAEADYPGDSRAEHSSDGDVRRGVRLQVARDNHGRHTRPRTGDVALGSSVDPRAFS